MADVEIRHAPLLILPLIHFINSVTAIEASFGAAAKNHSAPHENNIKVFAPGVGGSLFNVIHSSILFFFANEEMSGHSNAGVQGG